MAVTARTGRKKVREAEPTASAAGRESIREVCLVGAPGGSTRGGVPAVSLGGRRYEVEAESAAPHARYWFLRATTVG